MSHSHPKTSYHPAVLIAFYLNCLPDDLLQKIPRSTQFGWQHKNLSACFGFSWYCNNRHLFATLEQVSNSKTLLQINTALIRIIAIKRFIANHAVQLREKIFNTAATAVANIKKAQDVLGAALTLKLLDLSCRQYWQLKQKTRCGRSLLDLCLPKHPGQLIPKEVNVIKKYSEETRFIHWPLSSVYHQIIRDGAARFHLSTFYKYAGLLKLKRGLPKHRRKNHCT